MCIESIFLAICLLGGKLHKNNLACQKCPFPNKRCVCITVGSPGRLRTWTRNFGKRCTFTPCAKLVSRSQTRVHWGEPERAPHERYSYARIIYYIILYYYYYGTSVTRNYIPVMLYGHKREIFYCAFSCLGRGPYIPRSNLANCKFTLMLILSRRLQRWTELVSSTAQGPAKNVIKID